MPTSVIIDLVIAAVFVLCVALGAKRGLFRSFAELVVVLLALLVAAKGAAFTADTAVDRMLRPVAQSLVEKRVDELMDQGVVNISLGDGLQRIVEALPGDALRRGAEEILAAIEVPDQIGDVSAAGEVLTALGNEMLDALLGGMVRNLLYTVAFLLIFLVLTVLLRLLVRALDLPFHLPVLRQINAFGGLLFGGIKGVLLLWLAIWFLTGTGLLLTAEVVEETRLLKLLIPLFSAAGFPTVPTA